MYLFELQFCLNICPGVRLPSHMVILFLIFWGTSILFSIVALPTYIPTSSEGGFPFLHTLSSICYLYFLMMISIRRYHTVVLTCISLIISNVEHLFMCLVVICMSLEKCLFRFSAYFSIGFYVLLLLKETKELKENLVPEIPVLPNMKCSLLVMFIFQNVS